MNLDPSKLTYSIQPPVQREMRQALPCFMCLALRATGTTSQDF